MKTLIAYATNHGAAEKCAKMLKQRMKEEVELINLKQVKNINLNEYDKVIVGGSIYAGTIQKSVTEFCTKNIDILKQKKIGLFISCMTEDTADIQLNTVFPQELLNSAAAKEACGGEYNFKDMNFMEKLIIKMIAKPSNTRENISKISEEKIDKLAHAMS